MANPEKLNKANASLRGMLGTRSATRAIRKLVTRAKAWRNNTANEVTAGVLIADLAGLRLDDDETSFGGVTKADIKAGEAEAARGDTVPLEDLRSELEDDARELAIARDLLEEHGEHGECLTLMVKRLVANQQAHAFAETPIERSLRSERDDLRAQLEKVRAAETALEAAREALAEAGVECETVAEGIRKLTVECAEAEDEVLHERARKAEAAGGVGLLRRLRDELRCAYPNGSPHGSGILLGDVWLRIDRLIAEAEAQPAEEPKREPQEPDHQPQEGDEVLRAFLDDWTKGAPYRRADQSEEEHATQIAMMAAAAELVRRALR